MAATIYEREIPTAKEHDNRAKLWIWIALLPYPLHAVDVIVINSRLICRIFESILVGFF